MFDRSKLVTFQDIRKHDKIALWGAGVYTEELIDMLGKNKIVAIFDSDKFKWGKKINGIKILDSQKYFESIVDCETIIVISVASCNYEIANQIISRWKIPEHRIFAFTHRFGEKYMYDVENIFLNRHRIEEAISTLADSQSKEYFINTINARITRNPLYLKENDCIINSYEYLYEGSLLIAPKRGNVIIDCGAYIGDTSKIFLEKTNYDCRIFAIEPFCGNYLELCKWIKMQNLEKKVFPIHALLGEVNGKKNVKASTKISVSSSIENNGEYSNQVLLKRLDDIVSDKVSFIKMDIEGAEIAALKGATQIIQRDKPQMMISAYHRTNHMWDIPILIKQIEPSYKIFCGHQLNAAFEPEFYLTV